MGKDKKFHPNFKVREEEEATSPPEEPAVGDFVKSQEAFDDSAYKNDLSDAEMGSSTSPERAFYFVGHDDVFAKKPSNKKPKHT
eukprot:599929-Alexandrium_andersonii.AAC.1